MCKHSHNLITFSQYFLKIDEPTNPDTIIVLSRYISNIPDALFIGYR